MRLPTNRKPAQLELRGFFLSEPIGRAHDPSEELAWSRLSLAAGCASISPSYDFLGNAAAYSAIRVFTSFRTNAVGNGLSTGKRIVPLLVS